MGIGSSSEGPPPARILTVTLLLLLSTPWSVPTNLDSTRVVGPPPAGVSPVLLMGGGPFQAGIINFRLQRARSIPLVSRPRNANFGESGERWRKGFPIFPVWVERWRIAESRSGSRVLVRSGRRWSLRCPGWRERCKWPSSDRARGRGEKPWGCVELGFDAGALL